ncbi:MAG: efflux RND transporter periplasmic adaptor subunit [Cyclobacteriaceae bacterium]|nr:efflux RND transporter periplasmic adaptor subunit [Cyclobacteriaceae bacterium]
MTSKILMLMCFCAILGFTGCGSHKEEHESETHFLVTSPLKKDTVVTRTYVCQIHAIQHIELRSRESGYLEKIYVDEGQFVKKGQLMFQIMPLLFKAEVQKAEAEARFAEIEYLNTKQLADSNVVSPNELALAQAKFDKAKAEVALTKVHLGFTEIKAPFSGIMDRFYVREGSLINEEDLLTMLSDNSEMWVYFNVPEAEYLNYKMNAKRDSLMRVELQMANNQIFEYPGFVRAIEADFNNETGNIAFRATFPNPKGLLRHGETGNVLASAPYRNALIIPQKATFEILEKKYVFVVDKDNIVHQKEITIAEEMPDIYIIKDGITATDKIIYEGIRKVRDQEKIGEYKYEDPKTVVNHLKVYVE